MLSLDSLDTERRNINTMNLDELSAVEIIEKINQEDEKIADCVKPAIPEIGKAVEFAVDSIKKGGRLIYSTCTMTRAENEENFTFISEFKGFSAVDFSDKIRGYVDRYKDGERLVNEAIEFTGLQSHEKMLEKKLSGGLKRRLNIACGISHKPELVILDEPTVAVDAQSRKFILDGIKNLAENGSSILYTTHYLDEAEYLCNKISIMDNGKNILTGDMQTLINGVSVKEKITVVGFIKPEIISILEKQDEVIDVEAKENQVTFNYSTDTGNIKKLIYLLDENNVVYEEIFSKKPKLEDIFLEMTGKELRE